MTVEILNLESFLASQILGDGNIRSRNVLEMTHSDKWYDYLCWKRDLAISLGLEVSEPTIRTIMSNISEQTVVRCYVRIPNVSSMVKSPADLVGDLDSLGLLLWWLDDGCLIVHEKKNGYSVSRFGYLCTEQFDQETNFKIAKSLFYRFNLDCRVHVDSGGIKGKNTVYYRLYLNATNMRLMIDIVRDHIASIPPSMIYKLNMGYRPSRIKNSIEYTNMYNFL